MQEVIKHLRKLRQRELKQLNEVRSQVVKQLIPNHWTVEDRANGTTR